MNNGFFQAITTAYVLIILSFIGSLVNMAALDVEAASYYEDLYAKEKNYVEVLNYLQECTHNFEECQNIKQIYLVEVTGSYITDQFSIMLNYEDNPLEINIDDYQELMKNYESSIDKTSDFIFEIASRFTQKKVLVKYNNEDKKYDFYLETLEK